jgi:hypothetical protein
VQEREARGRLSDEREALERARQEAREDWLGTLESLRGLISSMVLDHTQSLARSGRSVSVLSGTVVVSMVGAR